MVFDLETTGLSPDTAEAIQVAGKAYDARTLEPHPPEAGGEFVSMMRPLHPERLDSEDCRKALAVNRKTKEEILAAPDQKVVWNEFVAWVNRFNAKKTKWTAPIAGGKNIRDFDLRFVAVLNDLHCKKKDKTVLFHARRQLDLEDLVFAWFEADPELEDHKMDTLREYFGMPTENGHDALVDVRQTGAIIMRLLNIHRELRRRVAKDGGPLIRLKGSLAGVC